MTLSTVLVDDPPMEVDLVGGNHHVHPELTAWEWPVAAYLFVGGLVAGVMIIAGVLGLRRSQAAPFRRVIAVADRWALPALIVGLVLLWVDLASRWNVWRLYTTFRLDSAMSWGSWILAFALVVAAVRFTANGLPDRRLPGRLRPLVAVVRRGAERRRRSLDVVTVVLGVGVGIYTGVLLSSISARPLWDTPLLAPLFLVSGVTAGGALLLLSSDAETRHRLTPSLMGLGVVELALLLWFVTGTEGRPGVADSAWSTLSSGGFGVAFWGGVIAAGILVPLSIEVVDRTRPLAVGWPRAASALTLTGSATLRGVVLFAGLASVS